MARPTGYEATENVPLSRAAHVTAESQYRENQCDHRGSAAYASPTLARCRRHHTPTPPPAKRAYSARSRRRPNELSQQEPLA